MARLGFDTACPSCQGPLHFEYDTTPPPVDESHAFAVAHDAFDRAMMADDQKAVLHPLYAAVSLPWRRTRHKALIEAFGLTACPVCTGEYAASQEAMNRQLRKLMRMADVDLATPNR